MAYEWVDYNKYKQKYAKVPASCEELLLQNKQIDADRALLGKIPKAHKAFLGNKFNKCLEVLKRIYDTNRNTYEQLNCSSTTKKGIVSLLKLNEKQDMANEKTGTTLSLASSASLKPLPTTADKPGTDTKKWFIIGGIGLAVIIVAGIVIKRRS